jgi:hypothetical protein
MVGVDADPSLTADEAGQLKMMQIVLVGLGAGAAASLLFASVVSGSLAAVFLFYLAPLPILIAALGWSHWAGLIAATVVAAVIGSLSGLFFISVFVIAFGGWWLAYLALLARPAANGGGEALEWYPVGRLLLWTAVLGSLVVAAAIPNFGTDLETLQTGLRRVYERILRDPAAVDLLVWAVPPAAGVFSTVITVINLYLAARVVRLSGRLPRPWPDLAAITLPTSTLGLLAAALAGSVLPDLPGLFARIFAASLLMAFAFLGYAVLHAVTRGMDSRFFLLAGAYMASFVIIWLLLAAALLGIAETLFNLRARVAHKRGPPTLRT